MILNVMFILELTRFVAVCYKSSIYNGSHGKTKCMITRELCDLGQVYSAASQKVDQITSKGPSPIFYDSSKCVGGREIRIPGLTQPLSHCVTHL